MEEEEFICPVCGFHNRAAFRVCHGCAAPLDHGKEGLESLPRDARLDNLSAPGNGASSPASPSHPSSGARYSPPPRLPSDERLEIRHYLVLLRRWLWLVFACALLAAGIAFIASSRTTPVYRASATLLVHQAPSSGTSDYTALLTSERLARTYTQMLTGRAVMEAVINQLGLNTSPGGLASRVKVSLVRDTQLIHLSVEDTDPLRAADTANAIAQVFIAQNQELQQDRYSDSLASMRQQIDELSTLIEESQIGLDSLNAESDGNPQGKTEIARLETILAGYRNTYMMLLQNYEQMRLTAAQSADNLVVLEPANPPSSPVRPNTMKNTTLAGLLGAILAIGVAFFVEYLDDAIKKPDDIPQALSLDALGAIGQFDPEAGELIMLNQPLSPISEAFRVLRTNIRFSNVDRNIRTLLVTSPSPTDGKTVTVANLAVAMAQAGLRVAAVDADLRRPRLHKLFDLYPHGGLTASLLEDRLDGNLQHTQVEGLWLLPAGELPPNPAEILGSQRMQEMLKELADRVDVVLIDSSPVLPVADAAILSPIVDGVLLVVEAGQTRRQTARQAVESLQQVGGNLIGVVLNAMPRRGGGYYYYRYYYNRYYGGDNGNQRRKRRQRTPSRRRTSTSSHQRASARQRRNSAEAPSRRVSPEPERTLSPSDRSSSLSSSPEPSTWGDWVLDEESWVEGSTECR